MKLNSDGQCSERRPEKVNFIVVKSETGRCIVRKPHVKSGAGCI